MKIMGLEKTCPELLLCQVVRHIFTIFLLHCKYNENIFVKCVPVFMTGTNNTVSASKSDDHFRANATSESLVKSTITTKAKVKMKFTCRIGPEDGFNNIRCQIIS